MLIYKYNITNKYIDLYKKMFEKKSNFVDFLLDQNQLFRQKEN
jgi:hypothetical protein